MSQCMCKLTPRYGFNRETAPEPGTAPVSRHRRPRSSRQDWAAVAKGKFVYLVARRPEPLGIVSAAALRWPIALVGAYIMEGA
jgi:hypothetical protein